MRNSGTPREMTIITRAPIFGVKKLGAGIYRVLTERHNGKTRKSE